MPPATLHLPAGGARRSGAWESWGSMRTLLASCLNVVGLCVLIVAVFDAIVSFGEPEARLEYSHRAPDGKVERKAFTGNEAVQEYTRIDRSGQRLNLQNLSYTAPLHGGLGEPLFYGVVGVGLLVAGWFVRRQSQLALQSRRGGAATLD